MFAAAMVTISSSVAVSMVYNKKIDTTTTTDSKKQKYDPNLFSVSTTTPGAYISSLTAKDPSDCYMSCQADTECKQWLFESNTCTLYRGNPMPETFYLKNDEGMRWSTKSYKPSWQLDSDRDTCGSECQSNASCQGFMYGDDPYPSCLMYDAAGTSDVISGFR